MLSVLISILGIIVTILLVIGVHEFGHFIVARLCGIKVLRFSIGFGKPLRRWHDKSGTEYVFAAIPLGGYIKMLDETEENVAPEDLPFSYNRQPLYKRVAVIIAGPVFNIIFAALLYWTLFIVGFTTIKPIIGEIKPQSIAAMAGLKPQEEIIQINNVPTSSWYSVTLKILMYSGDRSSMQVTTQAPQTKKTVDHTLDLTHWHMDELRPDPLDSLGITPYYPEIPTTIGVIQENSPAAQANLKIGDKILAIDNKPIKNWLDLVTLVSAAPNKSIQLKILRGNNTLIVPVTIGIQRSALFHKQGYLGIAPKITLKPELLRINKYGPLEAIPRAIEETGLFLKLNFIVFSKMITGKISLRSLGGPITIFESAGTALNQGITPFLGFLAFLSISIGFINILPIPGLDGGHLLFQVIEFIIRRPISVRTQVLFYRIGLILLMLLIVQAVANDIMRL
jgi:regulator of sigma E protease